MASAICAFYGSYFSKRIMKNIITFIKQLFLGFYFLVKLLTRIFLETQTYKNLMNTIRDPRFNVFILALKLIGLIYASIWIINNIYRKWVWYYFDIAIILAICNVMYFIIKALIEEELFFNTYFLEYFFKCYSITEEYKEYLRSSLRNVVVDLTTLRKKIRQYNDTYIIIASFIYLIYYLLNKILN